MCILELCLAFKLLTGHVCVAHYLLAANWLLVLVKNAFRVQSVRQREEAAQSIRSITVCLQAGHYRLLLVFLALIFHFISDLFASPLPIPSVAALSLHFTTEPTLPAFPQPSLPSSASHMDPFYSLAQSNRFVSIEFQ